MDTEKTDGTVRTVTQLASKRPSSKVTCLKIRGEAVSPKMPLVKRTVEPIYIGRAPLDKSVKNELEGVVVNSLAGVIKQLSSLSKHAENLFGDLVSEANNLFTRSATLNLRVQVLYEKTSQLDSAVKGDGEPTAPRQL